MNGRWLLLAGAPFSIMAGIAMGQVIGGEHNLLWLLLTLPFLLWNILMGIMLYYSLIRSRRLRISQGGE
ncbi:hypothetical protein LCGC14_1099200 [marine sediment metagenome]|uniref:Uncharacterized protein n=1 Tax=marine sediment metagenome TaxID=412755 RepID=A0A0F9MXY0_9ZZZZ